MRFLIKKKKPKVIHFFSGSDTACKMYSAGGLNKDRYEIIEEKMKIPMGLKICTMCKNNGNKKNKEKKPKKKKTVVVNNFYKTERWIKLRYQALKLSNGKCELCGVSGNIAVLNVDHIKPRGRYPEFRYKLSNLQVLCATCNHGKGWKDETDWRDEEMKERFLNAMHTERKQNE